MKGELLLVECEPLGPALEVLRSAPGVQDVAVFGNALHLVVENADATQPQLHGLLAGHNIRLNHTEEIRPSLEDVFVSLTTENQAKQERVA